MSPREKHERTMKARWIESQALRLRRNGETFQKIADSIGRLGRGEEPGRPSYLSLPPDFRISHQAVQKAIRRALDRMSEHAARAFLRSEARRAGGELQSLSPRARIARWVERRAFDYRRVGYSFRIIADLLTRIGRGSPRERPADIDLPADYKISPEAVRKAYNRVVFRESNREAALFVLAAQPARQLWIERCTDLYASLQPALNRGNLRAAQQSVNLIRQMARIDGYWKLAPMKRRARR